MQKMDMKKTNIFVNDGTWVDHNLDDPPNTATFVEIDSNETTDRVALLKCIGTEKLENILPAESEYVQR